MGAQLFVRGNSKLLKVYTDLVAQRDEDFNLGLEIINTYISLYEDTLKQFHTSGVDFMIINKIEFHLNKIKKKKLVCAVVSNFEKSVLKIVLFCIIFVIGSKKKRI